MSADTSLNSDVDQQPSGMRFDRCIWCLADTTQDPKTDAHVVPAALGNFDQVLLPPGAECRDCNHFFGQDLEQLLTEDPHIHILRVVGRVGNLRGKVRDEIFDSAHPSVTPVNHKLDIHETITAGTVRLEVEHGIQGTLQQELDQRQLAKLSRAVHLIAFRCMAYSLGTSGTATVGRQIDVYSAEFQPCREWVRRGQPRGKIRPVLRRPSDMTGTPEAMTARAIQYGYSLFLLDPHIGCELEMFLQQYVVLLTGAHNDVVQLFQAWPPNTDPQLWVLGDVMQGLDSYRGTPGEANRDDKARGSVHLQAALLAESLASELGKPILAGIFDQITPEGPFPVLLRESLLAMTLFVRGFDAGYLLPVRVELVDQAGVVSEKYETTIVIPGSSSNAPGQDHRTVYHAVTLTGMPFAHPGSYSFRIYLEGREAGSVPLHVQSPSARLVTGR